jgi:two-component system, chemotaxis family, sensor kinase CheA
LTAAVHPDVIRDVFLFVEDGSELRIEPGEDLPVDEPAANVPLPVEESRAPGAQVHPREATVRVPAERLDRLVNLVGELVMNQSRLATAAARFRAPELAAPVEEIERLVAELRDDVLQIRMMPIGTIFARFRRLVHDLSQQLGKEIELVTEGEETELDKSILDQLGEPLVHLLRNSIDHGVEPVTERLAKGKARQGTIRLIAAHRGSDVVVTIEDDGAGLDRAAIRAKAVSKQIIAADANLTDKELLNLILLPGFSTAQSITSVSGRGVGMDVVKRQIDALRGSLTVASEPGKGASVSLTLPLTLAIIDGLLVEAGESQYIIPMAVVAENVELMQAERTRNNGRNIVAVRGELIPYIDLREAFQMEGVGPAISKIVLVRYEDQRIGLVVDRVLGTHQTVIQALGKFFRNIEVVSGSTVMGDGRVALILDIAGVVRLADRRCGEAGAWTGAEGLAAA